MNNFSPVILLIALFISCTNSTKVEKLKTNEKSRTAEEIMTKAHAKAGGEFWQNPQTLSLFGHGLFYENGEAKKHEKHNMWRVYESKKEKSHSANGKVRIESYRDGKPIFVVSFDGENTYDLNGQQDKSEADKRWASNFGYGAIRHAFDKGYKMLRIEDDIVRGEKTYQIEILDPTGGKTQFDITQEDFKIVAVAFDTPRGWHERIYSDFFSKSEYSWLQSGRVELYYKEELSNTIFWTDFEVNEELPDSLFVLK